MKVSDYQLCEQLRKVSGFSRKARPGESAEEYFLDACNCGRFELPFAPDCVFIFYEPIPVLADIRKPALRSLIASQLLDRGASGGDDVGLTVDSLHTSAKDALYFVRLCTGMDEVARWHSRMNFQSVSSMVNSIDDEYILIASTVCSFVTQPGD